jgi:hypothetical protein
MGLLVGVIESKVAKEASKSSDTGAATCREPRLNGDAEFNRSASMSKAPVWEKRSTDFLGIGIGDEYSGWLRGHYFIPIAIWEENKFAYVEISRSF